MSSFESVNVLARDDERHPVRRAAVAIALLAIFGVLFLFAPPADPSKVVAGLPCSVLSENAISAVFGTTMRLMPTSGTVCHYVATQTSSDVSLFVIAHRETHKVTFDVVPRPANGFAQTKLVRLALATRH
jgi:hypothetical protein